MGYPDPQHPGEHPGGQNYPVGPGTPNVPKPTREYERPGDPGPPPGPPAPVGGPTGASGPGPAGPVGPGPQDPPTQAYDGGYQLGYAPGAYGDQYGQYGAQPPQGPPPGPGGPGGGSGGDGGGSGGNRKMLWIAAAAVVFVLVLAVIVALVATSGSPENTASSQTTTTAPPTTTTTSGRSGGITLPSGVPSGISIPPIFGGGSSTGPDARQWRVEVTGSGSAQLVTVGVPDTNLFGSQPLPWSKQFTSDSFMVTVTVLGYTGDVGCSITRNGKVVSEESSTDGSGGPLICSAGR
ncbi:hypothetical protein JVY00_04630 [Tsukamurella tyrosinosolvens]|uniref:hypothetical protein n=1 Tax=Tsukamurella tyrosinosolvens TaxID=57704 RepID=UPI001AF06444|nr:hypothetical protein [Tsukamurella tyrosinosolvens]QRY85378.1 hypothetical protein JVY00_04630 [Tsukamurella tyrosinosolvens]